MHTAAHVFYPVLKTLPPEGAAQVKKALQDPESRGPLMRLLASRDPKQALVAQAVADINEAVQPTGKTIVFKEIANIYGRRIKTAQESLESAMPDKDTPRGRLARDIILYTDNPRKTLTDFYTAIVADRIAPEVNWEPTGDGFIDLGEYADAFEDGGIGLGLSFRKIVKKIQGTRRSIANTLVKVTQKLGPLGFVMTPLLVNPVTIGIAGFSPIKAAATSMLTALPGIVKGLSGTFGGVLGGGSLQPSTGTSDTTNIYTPGGLPGSPGSTGLPGSPGAAGREGTGISAAGGGFKPMPPTGYSTASMFGDIPWWVWAVGGTALVVGVITMGETVRREPKRQTVDEFFKK